MYLEYWVYVTQMVRNQSEHVENISQLQLNNLGNILLQCQKVTNSLPEKYQQDLEHMPGGQLNNSCYILK